MTRKAELATTLRISTPSVERWHSTPRTLNVGCRFPPSLLTVLGPRSYRGDGGNDRSLKNNELYLRVVLTNSVTTIPRNYERPFPMLLIMSECLWNRRQRFKGLISICKENLSLSSIHRHNGNKPQTVTVRCCRRT